MAKIRIVKKRSEASTSVSNDLRGLPLQHIARHFLPMPVVTIRLNDLAPSISSPLLDAGFKEHSRTSAHVHYVPTQTGQSDDYRRHIVLAYSVILNHVAHEHNGNTIDLWIAETFPWALRESYADKIPSEVAPIDDLYRPEEITKGHRLRVSEFAANVLVVSGCHELPKSNSSNYWRQITQSEAIKLLQGEIDAASSTNRVERKTG